MAGFFQPIPLFYFMSSLCSFVWLDQNENLSVPKPKRKSIFLQILFHTLAQPQLCYFHTIIPLPSLKGQAPSDSIIYNIFQNEHGYSEI